MDSQIVTRKMQWDRGAAAARRNEPRDSHCMNFGADAIKEWQKGHDYVTKARQQHARGRAAAGAQP